MEPCCVESHRPPYAPTSWATVFETLADIAVIAAEAGVLVAAGVVLIYLVGKRISAD